MIRVKLEGAAWNLGKLYEWCMEGGGPTLNLLAEQDGAMIVEVRDGRLSLLREDAATFDVTVTVQE